VASVLYAQTNRLVPDQRAGTGAAKNSSTAASRADHAIAASIIERTYGAPIRDPAVMHNTAQPLGKNMLPRLHIDQTHRTVFR
jgi:hypothetical protein